MPKKTASADTPYKVVAHVNNDKSTNIKFKMTPTGKLALLVNLQGGIEKSQSGRANIHAATGGFTTIEDADGNEYGINLIVTSRRSK